MLSPPPPLSLLTQFQAARSSIDFQSEFEQLSGNNCISVKCTVCAGLIQQLAKLAIYNEAGCSGIVVRDSMTHALITCL